jgi:hypothetical protein
MYNGTYEDYIQFEDYQCGYSGTSCDLFLTINNGCSYGYTQLNFSGPHCGALIQNTGCGNLLLGHTNCAGLCISSGGIVTTVANLNIGCGLCINGSNILPITDGTYSFYNDGTTQGQVTSITFTCGIATCIAQIP